MKKPKLPAAVLHAIVSLEEAGFSSYLVGGAVRDHLRGLSPHDFDLATSAQPDEVKVVFAGARLIDTGIKHGTVTLLTDNGPIEITTYRIENGYSDSRHPDGVRFVKDVRVDLSRRDFTVNAMAYNPQKGLVDPFGGQRDLQKHILRCVGVPHKRFEEDALRILRALRLSAFTGFVIEKDTEDAMRDMAKNLAFLSSERLFSEITRLLLGRYAGRVLRTYPEILQVVIPEIAPMVDCEQENPHHLFDVYEHSVRTVEAAPATPSMRWAALFHDAGKPACKTVDPQGIGHFYGHPAVSAELAEKRLHELTAPREMTEEVSFLVRQHDIPFGEEEHLIRRRLSQLGEPRFRALLMLKKSDCVGQGTHPDYLRFYADIERMGNRILAEGHCLTVRDLCLNGFDLQFLGLSGAEIGQMQRWLLSLVLANPSLNRVKTLRDLVLERMEEAEA